MKFWIQNKGQHPTQKCKFIFQKSNSYVDLVEFNNCNGKKWTILMRIK